LKRTSGRGRLALGDQKKIETVTKSIFAILPNAAEEDHLHAEAAAARFFPADVGEWLLSLARPWPQRSWSNDGEMERSKMSGMSCAAGRESVFCLQIASQSGCHVTGCLKQLGDHDGIA
jgi:hypothetical protein